VTTVGGDNTAVVAAATAGGVATAATATTATAAVATRGHNTAGGSQVIYSGPPIPSWVYMAGYKLQNRETVARSLEMIHTNFLEARQNQGTRVAAAVGTS
jgi:hypothetical protein